MAEFILLCLWPTRQIFVEELVQFGIRHHAGEAVELAFRNLPRRLHESMHGYARERAADADATHTHCSEIANRIAERTTVEKIDRFRCHCLDRCRDLFAGSDTRRIQAIGSRIGEGFEPADGFVQVRVDS